MLSHSKPMSYPIEVDLLFLRGGSMAYRFQVNETACINCGICMDLCPVRCLDMSRPAGKGRSAARPSAAALSPVTGRSEPG